MTINNFKIAVKTYMLFLISNLKSKKQIEIKNFTYKYYIIKFYDLKLKGKKQHTIQMLVYIFVDQMEI